ncbi:MAG: hypothetical protein ACK559_25640, partial [bacterium]
MQDSRQRHPGPPGRARGVASPQVARVGGVQRSRPGKPTSPKTQSQPLPKRHRHRAKAQSKPKPKPPRRLRRHARANRPGAGARRAARLHRAIRLGWVPVAPCTPGARLLPRRLGAVWAVRRKGQAGGAGAGAGAG